MLSLHLTIYKLASTKSISLKIVGEDRKLQTLHLIGNAAYKRKGH